MDILVGLIIGYLIGAMFMAIRLTKSKPERKPKPVIERSQAYHDSQAYKLLAECEDL